jgi:hypothetical protein
VAATQLVVKSLQVRTVYHLVLLCMLFMNSSAASSMLFMYVRDVGVQKSTIQAISWCCCA